MHRSCLLNLHLVWKPDLIDREGVGIERWWSRGDQRRIQSNLYKSQSHYHETKRFYSSLVFTLPAGLPPSRSSIGLMKAPSGGKKDENGRYKRKNIELKNKNSQSGPECNWEEHNIYSNPLFFLLIFTGKIFKKYIKWTENRSCEIPRYTVNTGETYMRLSTLSYSNWTFIQSWWVRS